MLVRFLQHWSNIEQSKIYCVVFAWTPDLGHEWRDLDLILHKLYVCKPPYPCHEKSRVSMNEMKILYIYMSVAHYRCGLQSNVRF